jgi:hypothetical protein
MKLILPLTSAPKINPPYSLVESYIALTLLTDEEYGS